MQKPTLAFVLVVAGAAGCHRTEAAADSGAVSAVSASASADMVGAVAPIDDDAGVTIAPPAALVQADSTIPLNEAVVGTPANIPANYSASFAPPTQAVDETARPSQPDADSTWVPGYWWFSAPLARYVWVGGAWRHPPQDQVWVGGSWAPRGGRYTWSPGYWGPRGYNREVVDVAPPPMRVEERPPSPGVDFVWTPGYHVYRGGAYAWTGGTWTRPPSAGVTWVEPRYVQTGGRYYMQPGRWDVPVERRGIVYRPDIDVRPGARVVLAPVAVNVVVEHEHFVHDSSRAIAHGAVADPRGVFVVPRAVVRTDVREVVREHEHEREHVEPVHVDEHVHVEEHVRAPEEHGRVVVEEHGRAPEGRVETHVNAPHVETRVEVHQQPQQPVPVQQRPQARPQEHEQRHR
jgi:hypothetical protein